MIWNNITHNTSADYLESKSITGVEAKPQDSKNTPVWNTAMLQEWLIVSQEGNKTNANEETVIDQNTETYNN